MSDQIYGPLVAQGYICLFCRKWFPWEQHDLHAVECSEMHRLMDGSDVSGDPFPGPIPILPFPMNELREMEKDPVVVQFGDWHSNVKRLIAMAIRCLELEDHHETIPSPPPVEEP